MVDRICNCVSQDVENFFCSGWKKPLVKTVLMSGAIIYFWLSYIILDSFLLECTKKWTRRDYEVFTILYLLFSVFYFIVFEAIMKPFECIWFTMVKLYKCMSFCLRYIWKHMRMPTRSDFRLTFFVRRPIERNQPQLEVSNSASELNDDRPPPLPPRNRVVVKPETTMFQKLTSKVSAGTKSRTTIDENLDLSSSHLQRPHCSKQSVESSRRRNKKLTKRSHFKSMMSKVTNLQAISEEDLNQKGASGIKVPLSTLIQNSSSDTETEKETSLIVESYQYGAVGQDFDNINIESGEQALTQTIYGTETLLKSSIPRDEKRDLGKISASILVTKKGSVDPDPIRQSPEQPSTSDFVPVFEIWNPTSSPRKLALINAPISKFGTVAQMINLPLSSFENLIQEETLEDAYCGFQGEQMASGMQSQSLKRLSELGGQSKAFGTGVAEKQTSFHQPLTSLCHQISQIQTQEQTSTVAIAGPQHSKMSHIQKSQGKENPAVARYVKLPQLEEQLALSEIITKKQSSPEQSPLKEVSISLQSQVSSTPVIEKMSSGQIQASSADVSDLQKHGRIYDVQKRRLSRKHSPIPNYRKYSDSEKQSEEETPNLLQPVQSHTPFYLAENKLQTSGIGDTHESSSQERRRQIQFLQEASTPRTSRTSNILEKLRNLHKASAAGFPVATNEIRHVVDPVLPLLTDYAGEKFKGKAERANYQKRRGSLSLERPVRESNTRTRKTGFVAESTSRLSDSASGGLKASSFQRQQVISSGYTPHSVLPWSGGTPTQAHVAFTPLETEDEDQIGRQSYRDLSNLQEMYKLAAQRKAFLTLALGTGGLVVINKEGETGADSSEQSYMYDQPTDNLDVSHIEVPLSPDINPSKDESQNLDIPIHESSNKIERAEESIKSTPLLSTCVVGGLQTFSVQRRQIEESREGYTQHAPLSISTQTQEATTPHKESEDKIGKQSPSDPLYLKETDKEETQKSSLIRKLGTGGLLLSKEGAVNNEAEADSSETLFMHDQPIDTLDLTPIGVPLLPKYKGKGKSQISKEPIKELRTRTGITEQSVETTSWLSAWASEGVEIFSTQKQQIEASKGDYASHSTLPTSEGTSTQTHVLTTPLKRKEVEKQIWQQSSKDALHLKETEVLETEEMETFLTLDLATGGIVLSSER